MIIIHWTGKAVSKNRRFRIASNRKDRRPRLVRTEEYEAWLNSIGWTVRQGLHKDYKRFQWIMINASLDQQADHHNLVDVVLDALQRCGLIKDDRDAGVVMSMPCERHKRGEEDEIRLFIQPGEEL